MPDINKLINYTEHIHPQSVSCVIPDKIEIPRYIVWNVSYAKDPSSNKSGIIVQHTSRLSRISSFTIVRFDTPSSLKKPSPPYGHKTVASPDVIHV